MNALEPIDEVPAVPSRRDRRMLVTATISGLVHLLILGVLFLPRLGLPAPVAPESVRVDIVTPRQLASLESLASAPVSSQPPTSEASSETPSQQPSPLPSGGSPSSSASTIPPPPPPPKSGSSASAAPLDTQSTEPASGAPSSARLVIPVGSAESSSEAASSGDTSADAASSEASEDSAASEADTASSAAQNSTPSTLIAAGGPGGGAPVSEDDTAGSATALAPEAAKPPKPVGGGTLHPATAFYLKEMLRAPGLAQAKATLKTLSPERRLAQTCNIEAYGQIGHAGYQPNAIIANAFASVTSAGSTYTVTGGAFRSQGNWYRIAYQCTLKPDMSDVVQFAFHIGADVTDEMTARLSGGG